MNIAFLCSSVMPHKTGDGSSVLMYGLLNIFKELGNQVYVIPVSYRKDEEHLKKSCDFLTNQGFEVRLLDDFYKIKTSHGKLTTVREIVFPKPSDHYYVAQEEKKELNAFIKEANIDVVVGYSWEALGLMHNLKGVKKIASVVDLLNHRYEQRLNGLKHYQGYHKLKSTLMLRRERNMFDYTVSFLKEMDAIIEHAFQHADELRDIGLKNVYYIPHPLTPKEENFLSLEDKNDKHINVLILGSLKGIASRLGFEYFLDHLLPELKKQQEKLKKPMRFRIVGHGKMLPSLKERLLKEDNIDFIGFAESVEDEYKIADIMLVNIPISHGFRTRIAEAFSYGMCVVAHAANAEGMPEIKNGYNAATSADPKILANELIALANQPQKRYEMGQNAINTFNEEVSQDVALLKCKEIFEKLKG